MDKLGYMEDHRHLLGRMGSTSCSSISRGSVQCLILPLSPPLQGPWPRNRKEKLSASQPPSVFPVDCHPAAVGPRCWQSRSATFCSSARTTACRDPPSAFHGRFPGSGVLFPVNRHQRHPPGPEPSGCAHTPRSGCPGGPCGGAEVCLMVLKMGISAWSLPISSLRL